MSQLLGAVLAGSIALVALAAEGCAGGVTPEVAKPGCDAFPNAVSTLSLDANTTAFVSASASLIDLVTNLQTMTLNACAGIARDLLVDDTWTAKGPLNRGTADAEVSEACRQASRAITVALHPVVGDSGAESPIPCGVSVSGGGCTVDPNAQGACVATCSGGANCKAPAVLAACARDDLSGICTGMCTPGATCQGSAGAPAPCKGSCAAGCSGECDGTVSNPVECNGVCSGHCVGACTGGMMSAGLCTGTCVGKCDAVCEIGQGMTVLCGGTCKGSCTGDCKLSSMIDCGSQVNCKGGCTGTYGMPSCEGELAQPACGADANCQASCQGSTLIQASCQSPVVSLGCDALLTADVQALITTLQGHLPDLLEVGETQGLLAADAATTLSGVGRAIAKSPGNLTGTAVACALAAGRAASDAEVSITNAVTASVGVRSAVSSNP